MKTTIALSAAMLTLLTAPALAGAHVQGLEASAMGGALKELKGGASIASTLGGDSGLPQGGWGNVGSGLVDSDGNVSPDPEDDDNGPVSPADPKGLTD